MSLTESRTKQNFVSLPGNINTTTIFTDSYRTDCCSHLTPTTIDDLSPEASSLGVFQDTPRFLHQALQRFAGQKVSADVNTCQ